MSAPTLTAERVDSRQRERNVQWHTNGWTVSYLYRYGSLSELWIWRTREVEPAGGERRSHPYFYDGPAGVDSHAAAYEIVAACTRTTPAHEHDCEGCEYVCSLPSRRGVVADVYRACEASSFRWIVRTGARGEYVTTDELDPYVFGSRGLEGDLEQAARVWCMANVDDYDEFDDRYTRFSEVTRMIERAYRGPGGVFDSGWEAFKRAHERKEIDR